MDKLQGLRQKAAENLEKLGQAGMVIAVVQDDAVIFAEGFGYKDVEQNKKATEKTIFPIGSASKAFTATGVMLLQDRGLTDIDKPVRNYLPELVFMDPVSNSSVTARDLMCHRTGLPRHDGLWIMRGNLSRADVVEAIRYLEPSKPFRTTYQYNNLMFATAGRLVERVSNTRWEDFTRREIFEPLGMNTANFSTEDSVTCGDFAIPYDKNLKTGELDQVDFSRIAACGPAGSINGSVLDMAGWVRFNLGQGTFMGKTLMSKASYAHLVKPNILNEAGFLHFDEVFDQGYALGWSVDCFRGRTLVSHGGNVNGGSAVIGFMPEINAGVAIMVNTGGSMLPTAMMYDIIDRLTGNADKKDWAGELNAQFSKVLESVMSARAAKAPKKPFGPTHPLEDYCGQYSHPGYGVLRVALSEGNLFAKFTGMKVPLESLHYDHFTGEVWTGGNPMNFNFDFITGVSGAIESVAINVEPTPPVKPVVFKKV